MADMFLSPLISLVIDKAANELTQQFCQMWGMEDNRDKLHRYLLAVQKKIANAEEHAVDGSAEQAWMKELQAAAYEAVDVLDEFQYEALRREAIRQQPSSSTKVVKDFFSHENPLFFRQKISNKMTKILKKIDEIVNEMKTFELVQRGLVSTIDRETLSFITESEFIGRKDETEKIVNVLLDPQRMKDNISVLPIVGMGGLGKTTIAQLVYKRVERQFELPLWVCVSTNFNISDIMKSIIQVAKEEPDVSKSTKEALQQQLRKILEKKRYLLVLDDVWNEEGDKWDELKPLLFSAAGAGSVIVVTTRSKVVAAIMGTLPCIDLAFLTEEDSWALFEKRAFGAMVRDQSKEQIGRTIVRKCGGLPLAVKAMGGLVGTMSDVCDWRAVAENKIWEGLEASPGSIIPILSLSYDYLPPHTKQCFAFCAVFPQDYHIDVDDLIRLWMANDLIPTTGIMDLERKGRYIFKELHSRSFFQELTEEDTRYGRTITCKMHDLMHDLATRVAGKKCSTQLELSSLKKTQKEVQNLFVSGDQLFNLEIDFQFPDVHTLLVHGYSDLNNKKYPYLFKSSFHLRALQLRNMKNLPKELGYMRHLRYLDLSCTFVESTSTLPESITKLYNLQTLNLSRTKIRELPEGMRYMTNLRHLFLYLCDSLERMPAGLGQLKFLQTLTKYIVDPDRGVGIEELKNLNLCGYLSISGLEKVRGGVDAGAINLALKSGLYSLELRWSSLKETRENDKAVLEALRPHSNLKFLKIVSYGGTCFSEWMKEYSIMKNLKKLWLNECINCAELPLLWQLPLLEELYLWEMKSLIFIVSGTCKDADGSELLVEFSHLKILDIRNLQNLEGWHERDCELVQFPNLEYLIIDSCPKLKTIPHAWQLPLLEALELSKMESLISIVGGTCRNADGSEALIVFPHLKMLYTYDLPNLEGWHERDCELVQFPNLENLRINKCPKLKTIPTRISNCLLAKLTIANSGEINLRQISNLPMLSSLDIRVDTPPDEVNTFRPPKTLKRMEITGFTNVNPIEEKEGEEEQNWEAYSLRELTINNSQCFFSWERTRLALGFWKHFAALESLTIWRCNGLVYWPEEEFRNLRCLKRLWIYYCASFTGSLAASSSPTPRGGDSLPQLESLDIRYCPELVQLPGGSMPLEKLEIVRCPKLSREGLAGFTNLTKLKELWLIGLPNWRALPDNMWHLPSLEKLAIGDCPGLESLPQSLQQRLPSLQWLMITDCPVLVKHFWRGGNYWHLASAIPDKDISPEEEDEEITKSETIFRRLLLKCRRS